ncbi:MAG: hypothetical protein ACXAE3_16185 [Candidatus Kariarchaeaceae archaeon]|jgi:cytoskeletal protein CcmA (bactofilin family)
MDDDSESNLPVSYRDRSKSLFLSFLDEFSSDISLYDQVMATYDQSEFDHLKVKKGISVAGMTFFEGGKIEGAVNMAGKGTSQDDLLAQKLSVAGQSTFKGLVAISGKASIAGSSRFMGPALFGGTLKVAGKTRFDESIVGSGGVLVSGRAYVSQYLLTDSPISIAGRLQVQSIRSTDVLKIDGHLNVSESILAKEIYLGRSSGLIEGDVYAEKISILAENERLEKNLATVGGLFFYLKDTILGALQGKSRRRLVIEGDVFAEDVEMDEVTIHGDLVVKNGTLGPGVEVLGKVYYEASLQMDETLALDVEQKSLIDYTEDRKQLKE